MGNLRDGFFTQRPQGELTAQDLDALDVSSMNSLSRGWAAGRIGNDANALSAEEMNLRASGDVAGADALRQQIKGLDLRRGAYAPAVGRVEDVHGLGDVGSYIAGQVGQGAASMVDPMAVSAGLATAGRFLPGVAGRVAQGAALGVPYLMNQRQLTGEFGNAAYQDPELIARTSPTQLRDDANLYGAGAAVLDTALTGIVGRQVSGLSRAGGAMARKSVMGAGTKTALEMGLEGATETAQSMGSQYTLGQLNPNRDTSGDFSENLNSFVGGAVGAGPFAAAGAYAEAGHNRVGAGVDRVKDAAGTVIDMANGNETVQKAKGMFGKAKDGVIDLAKNDDGAASASALLDNLKAGAQELKSRGETSLEELSILRNTPPDDVLADETNAKLKAWDAENAPKRAELIASKLQGMEGSPEAAGLLEGLAEPDDGVYAQNLEKAAQFLIAEHPVGRVNERAATLGENLGKIAGVAGPAIGRGAVAVGKGVAGFAKAVLSGAKDEASKKNAQAAEESFGEWRDRNYGVRGQEAADSALKEGASYNKAVEFSQRAELAGSYASDMAQRGKGGMKYAQLAKHLAYTVANMLDTDAAKLDVKSRMVRLNRLTTDFHDIYKDAAPEVLTQLGVILGPQASPAVKHMIQQLEAQMSPGGRQAVVSERDQLARRVVGLISPKAQNALMQQGVNINTPGGREKVLGIMEDFADKISSTPHARAALDGLLGADSVRSVMELLNGQAEPKAAEVIDDRSEIEGGARGEILNSDDRGGRLDSNFERQVNENLVEKGTGAKIYAYGNGAGLRSSDERRDPFAASEKADVETGVVKRPAMFTKGQKLFGGADAIEKKMADLKKQLASDPAYPDHDNYRIEPKSAWDVMQDNKMQPGKVLQLYRDYMRADAADEKLSEGQRKYAAQQGKMAHSMILDSLSKQDADKSLKKHEFKTGPRERSELTKSAEAYFKERFVVVAEQISNRDPEKVTATEALALFQDGRRKLSAVRRDSQDLSEADQNLATSEANILYFTGKDEKGKPATVPVQAGKLVHFVRKQQGASSRMDAEESDKSFSNATKDAEFLTDLMTGIGMMIDSGHATGMPYMLNRFGKAESFTRGVPKSLMLATQTAGAKEFGDEKRREKLKVKTAEELAPDEEEVAIDQDRNDEFFTPEDRAERELQDGAAKSGGSELVTRGPNNRDINNPSSRGTSTSIRTDISGTTPHEPKFSGDSAGPSWDPKSTELDFSEGQGEGIDDETTDVLKRTKLGGKSAYSTDIGPEPKGKAADAAVHRAAAIGAAWNRSEAEGMEMIEMRFRMAAAPAYSENKNEAVGGPHYIAPVAAFVNATNLAGMDLGAKELKEFSSIRARVAQVLLSPEVSKTERVKLARLMSTDPAKVTSMNVDAMLTKLATKAETSGGAAAPLGKPSGARNAQQGPARVASQADMDEARTYVTKVLGPRIKVEFKNLTGYSGEFIDAKNVIEISTTAAAGTMGTAWHEAMHVFFRDFVKGNPGMIKTFEGLVNDPKHLAKLHALLSGFPAAQAQLHSGEERLAYTYQFWKAGLLQVDAEAKTWLQKIGKFFRRVMGMVRDSERALELFTAFDKGAMQDPSAAAQVIEKALGKGQWTLRQRQKLDALVQGVAAMTMPSAEVLEISVSAKARKLSRMLFTNPGEGESGSDKEGYLNARRRMATKYNNMFAQAIGDLNEGDQNIVQGYLQKETELTDIAYEPHRAAVKSIRSLLQRFHQYMTESGMEIGYAGDKYYPVVWSLDALLSNKAEFVEMLVTKYASNLDPLNGDVQKAAERVYEALINKDGVDAHIPASREDGVLAPFFASQNGRTLPWLAAVDREKYMQKNMIGTLSRYFHQGARSTEYFRRFGQDGVKLDAMLYGTKSWNPATKSEDRATDGIYHELLAASKEKSDMTPEQQKAWLTRQMRDVTRSVSAMEGTLGKDVSPTMRKFSSWMNVYQNIRLLPLSLFSSFVDPLGLLARGGTFQESYDAFLSGMREVFAGWRDAFRDMPAERQKNEWERLAEFVGTVDAAMFSHHVADEYSSVYMSPAAKKINDKMFVLNGMEAWNRGMRVAATKSAVKFIERHAKNADPAHSKRWLQELGLTAAQVYTDADGGLITDRHVLAQAHNMPLADATKKMEAIHYAINRWVEGAVLTPNAAQRPAWSSDPHYSMLFHLKQFSYSFHQTILKRAVAEMKHGNMAPMGAFIWYIPTMIAADITKGLIQGGGELPPYMKGYSAGDWLLHGYQRAGLSGIGVIGVDAAEDVASLGGPAVEQVIDGLRDPLERTAVNALPLHSVFAMAIN